MKRPDDEKFALFDRALDPADEAFERFAATHQGVLFERNVQRMPSRVLRFDGNPSALIYLDFRDHWFETKFETNLPCQISVILYYTPPEYRKVVFRLQKDIVEFGVKGFPRDFSRWLESAHEFIQRVKPEEIERLGRPSTNERYWAIEDP